MAITIIRCTLRRSHLPGLALALSLSGLLATAASATPASPSSAAEGTAPSAVPAPSTDTLPADTAAILAEILALKARANLQLQREDNARLAAEKALALDARNVTALQVLADLADRGADWREQADRWEQVAAATEDERYREMALRRAESILEANRNEIWFDSYFQRDDAGETFSGIGSGGRVVRDNAPDLLAEIRTRATDGDGAGRVDGREADALGGSIGLSRRFGARQWESRLEFSDHEVGTSGVLRHYRGSGYTGMRFRFNTPTFHYAAAISEAASADYFGLMGGHEKGRWRIDAEAGIANYTIADRIDVASAFRLDTTLDLRLGQSGVRAPHLRYAVSVENFSGVVDAGSEMPTADTRLQSLSLSRRLFDRLPVGTLGTGWLDAEAGYRVNQDDARGVFANLSGGMAVSRHRKLELSIQYEDLQNDIDNRQAPLGVVLTFRQLTGR